MAKIKSLFTVEGTLGGVSFYQGPDGQLARVSNSPSSQRIANDPAFARTRENNSEFGGSATIGKALRTGLAIVFHDVSDRMTTPRLVKLIKAVITNDASGIRGQRNFYPVLYKQVLEGFEFTESSTLYSRFSAPFNLSVNATRDQLTLSIPDFDAGNYVVAPSAATHFRITCAMVLLSSYSVPLGQTAYAPNDPANSSSDVSASNYLPIKGLVSSLPNIVCAFPAGVTPAADSAVLACVGIEFSQQVGATQYPLAGHAMRLMQVF